MALAHSGDGRLFLDRADDKVRVRDTATGRVLRRLEEVRSPYFGLFSQDGTRIVLQCSSYNEDQHDGFGLYDTQTGKKSGEIQPVDYMTHQAPFSPDGRLLALADRANAVHVHNAVTGKLVRTLRSARPLPTLECSSANVVFSSDGDHVAVAASLYESSYLKGKRVERRDILPMRVFHVPSGKEVRRFYSNPVEKSKAGRCSCGAWSPDSRLLALAEAESGIIRLIEIASGQVRAELAGHRHGVHGLAFSPDGKTLASGGEDNVVFLWDVTGTKTVGMVKNAGDQELAEWWTTLAAEDATLAGSALASLIRSPDSSIAILKARLRPAETVDEKRVRQCIADLDDASFKKREAASRELAELGSRAEAALQRALQGAPLELKRRLERLLEKLDRNELSVETLREIRAIEALEHLGTLEAQQILESLAKGADEARLTQEAKAALARLARTSASK